MTRHCVMSTSCIDNWDSVFCLDSYCKEELFFWKDNLINLNSSNCFVSKDPSYFDYSDGSALEVVHSLTLTMTLCVTKSGQ